MQPGHWLGRPLIAMIAAMSITATLGALPVPAAADPGSKQRIDQVIVTLNQPSGASIEAINTHHGTRTITWLATDPTTYLLQAPSGTALQHLRARLTADSRVHVAELNFLGRAPEAHPRGIDAWGGTDPSPGPLQPAVGTIRLDPALALSRGAGITVAILDTGLQLDHPAFEGALAPGGYDFIDGDNWPEDSANGLDDDGDGVIDEALGHGTHVAGIVRLVAPDARILPIRVLDSDGIGDVFTLVQAIEYATLQGATVINLSLGTDVPSEILSEAVRRASRAGVLVVASAGNDATGAPQFPAAYHCAIAVTSVDAAGNRSSFANYGPWISVAAPGERIFSAFPTSGYAWWSGTSMAAPFVAGQAALIRSAGPGLEVREVGAIIGGTAHGPHHGIGGSPVDDLATDSASSMVDTELGDGLIDLTASVEAALSGIIPPSRANRIDGTCTSDGSSGPSL
ncbi:MAG: hypothetical protein OHK0015_02800 [Chloroflexi bacterium OHK40]